MFDSSLSFDFRYCTPTPFFIELSNSLLTWQLSALLSLLYWTRTGRSRTRCFSIVLLIVHPLISALLSPVHTFLSTFVPFFPSRFLFFSRCDSWVPRKACSVPKTWTIDIGLLSFEHSRFWTCGFGFPSFSFSTLECAYRRASSQSNTMRFFSLFSFFPSFYVVSPLFLFPNAADRHTFFWQAQCPFLFVSPLPWNPLS